MPPNNTDDSAGSTTTIRISGLCCFNTAATPREDAAVLTQWTNASIFPTHLFCLELLLRPVYSLYDHINIFSHLGNMPKAFNELERERIRARLIAAGKASINRSGIRLLSVDEVVREAGISKGSFYSFFPSRSDFILSVFESWETEYRGELLKEISDGSGSPRERMERFFIGTFDILEREPGLAQIAFRDIDRLIESLPPERVAAHQAADESALSETFARWTEDGLIPPGFAEAFRGLVPALFVIAMHKNDFPPGSFRPAVRLIAEALAMRLSALDEDGKRDISGKKRGDNS